MARHAVYYTSRGATTTRNVRTQDGYPLLLMEEGETRKLALDFTDLLESGQSISTATVSAEGVTASISLSSPVATLTLSAPSGWGTAIVTITLSNGEVIVETIYVRQTSRAFDPSEVAYAL